MASLRSDGDPAIIADHDVFNGDRESIASVGSFEPNGATDGIRLRRSSIKPWSQRWNGFVLFRLKITGAGVIGFNFETLPAFDAQERLIFPIEGIFSALFAGDSLHHGPRPKQIARKTTPPMTARIRSKGTSTNIIAGIRFDLPVLPLYL